MQRRHFLRLSALATLAAACRPACTRLALPSEPSAPLSDGARALLDAAWAGLDPARVLDVHAHLLGAGDAGSGCSINPRMKGGVTSPMQSEVFSIYLAAAGVKDADHADRAFVEKLVERVRGQGRHGRLLLLAFDEAYHPDGTVFPEATEFHTPDAYVLEIAREFPDCFVPAASVHPYRKDALDALEKAAAAGAVAVKWLPNAMRIDPASPACDAYYKKLAELGLVLVSHAGDEKAVKAEDAQKLGNPLRFRRTLDAGVKLVMSHCASLGTNEDLDAPGEVKPEVPNFELFLRLMASPDHKDRLYGDLSALTQFNRAEVLRTLLSRTDLHERLVNGTDYPLPAISMLARMSKLESLGYVGTSERKALEELQSHNVLDADFVAKRTIRVTEDGVEKRFPPGAFMIRPELFPRLAPA